MINWYEILNEARVATIGEKIIILNDLEDTTEKDDFVISNMCKEMYPKHKECIYYGTVCDGKKNVVKGMSLAQFKTNLNKMINIK